MTIYDNYIGVRDELARACASAERNPRDVRLLAVSKTVGPEGVREAYDAGARDFGENRPDQLMEKQPLFPDARWHFIGNIQSRRIKDIVPHAYMIHSLYQMRHAVKIADEAARVGKRQRVLVEVNVSGEESKSGIASDEVDGFVDECLGLASLEVCGLMTMAPQGDLPEARRCFAALREIRDATRSRLLAQGDEEAANSFVELSMGMTDDWREAVAEGSTIARIGRAIFQA